ncbi:MAG: phage holin family protein [Bacteroidia bacterium]
MENESPRKQSRLAEIPGHVKDFAKTKLAYYKLSAIEGGAAAASGAVLGISLFFLGLFFFIFISIAAAIGLGYLVDNMALGFLFVALIYLLLAVLIFVMRDRLITNPITTGLINALANDNNDDSHEQE